ncbi:MAG: hypothetical protein OCC49_04465 [Fibrobacterales bacterium]
MQINLYIRTLFFFTIFIVVSCSENNPTTPHSVVSEQSESTELEYLFLFDGNNENSIYNELDTSLISAIVTRFEKEGKIDSAQAFLLTYNPKTGKLREEAKESPIISELLQSASIFAMGETAPLLLKQSIAAVPTNELGFSYRIHSQSHGWSHSEDRSTWIDRGSLGWSEKRLEAVQWNNSSIRGQGHVQNIGDTEVSNSIIGTTGQSRRLEAVRFWSTGSPYFKPGFMQYRTQHTGTSHWDGWKFSGQWAGSIGKSKTVDKVGIFYMKWGNGNAFERPSYPVKW